MATQLNENTGQEEYLVDLYYELCPSLNEKQQLTNMDLFNNVDKLSKDLDIEVVSVRFILESNKLDSDLTDSISIDMFKSLVYEMQAYNMEYRGQDNEVNNSNAYPSKNNSQVNLKEEDELIYQRSNHEIKSKKSGDSRNESRKDLQNSYKDLKDKESRQSLRQNRQIEANNNQEANIDLDSSQQQQRQRKHSKGENNQIRQNSHESYVQQKDDKSKNQGRSNSLYKGQSRNHSRGSVEGNRKGETSIMQASRGSMIDTQQKKPDIDRRQSNQVQFERQDSYSRNEAEINNSYANHSKEYRNEDQNSDMEDPNHRGFEQESNSRLGNNRGLPSQLRSKAESEPEHLKVRILDTNSSPLNQSPYKSRGYDAQQRHYLKNTRDDNSDGYETYDQGQVRGKVNHKVDSPYDDDLFSIIQQETGEELDEDVRRLLEDPQFDKRELQNYSGIHEQIRQSKKQHELEANMSRVDESIEFDPVKDNNEVDQLIKKYFVMMANSKSEIERQMIQKNLDQLYREKNKHSKLQESRHKINTNATATQIPQEVKRKLNLKDVYEFYCKQTYVQGKYATFERLSFESTIMTLGKFMYFNRDFGLTDLDPSTNKDIKAILDQYQSNLALLNDLKNLNDSVDLKVQDTEQEDNQIKNGENTKDDQQFRSRGSNDKCIREEVQQPLTEDKLQQQKSELQMRGESHQSKQRDKSLSNSQRKLSNQDGENQEAQNRVEDTQQVEGIAQQNSEKEINQPKSEEDKPKTVRQDSQRSQNLRKQDSGLPNSEINKEDSQIQNTDKQEKSFQENNLKEDNKSQKGEKGEEKRGGTKIEQKDNLNQPTTIQQIKQQQIVQSPVRNNKQKKTLQLRKAPELSKTVLAEIFKKTSTNNKEVSFQEFEETLKRIAYFIFLRSLVQIRGFKKIQEVDVESMKSIEEQCVELLYVFLAVDDAKRYKDKLKMVRKPFNIKDDYQRVEKDQLKYQFQLYHPDIHDKDELKYQLDKRKEEREKFRRHERDRRDFYKLQQLLKFYSVAQIEEMLPQKKYLLQKALKVRDQPIGKKQDKSANNNNSIATIQPELKVIQTPKISWEDLGQVSYRDLKNDYKPLDLLQQLSKTSDTEDDVYLAEYTLENKDLQLKNVIGQPNAQQPNQDGQGYGFLQSQKIQKNKKISVSQNHGNKPLQISDKQRKLENYGVIEARQDQQVIKIQDSPQKGKRSVSNYQPTPYNNLGISHGGQGTYGSNLNQQNYQQPNYPNQQLTYNNQIIPQHYQQQLPPMQQQQHYQNQIPSYPQQNNSVHVQSQQFQQQQQYQNHSPNMYQNQQDYSPQQGLVNNSIPYNSNHLKQYGQKRQLDNQDRLIKPVPVQMNDYQQYQNQSPIKQIKPHQISQGTINRANQIEIEQNNKQQNLLNNVIKQQDNRIIRIQGRIY